MNEDTVTGNWQQLSCKIKEKQAKRSADAIKESERQDDHPLGKLEAHYYRLAEQDLKSPGHA